MQCKKCKLEIPDESLYCMFCGAPQKRDKSKKMYQRPDGLYERIITVNKKRNVFRGKTPAEVNKKILEYTNTKTHGRAFKIIAEQWKEEIENKIAYNSTRNYFPAWKRAIDHFGDILMSNISPQDVQIFINQFARLGMAQKTVQTQLLILNMIFSKAVIDGDIKDNPAVYVKVPNGLSKGKRTLPSENEIEIIKNGLNNTFGLFPYFLLYTGCRLGEALAIQYKDIDRENKRIIINKSVYFVGNRPEIKEPKTEAGKREVILLDKLEKVLPAGKPTDFLFSDGNVPLTNSKYRFLWNMFCRETGLADKKKDKSGKAYFVPKITPHQLRHAYATILFEAGVDEKDAQELLGHANISVTKDIYTHIRKSKKDKTAELLNAYYG